MLGVTVPQPYKTKLKPPHRKIFIDHETMIDLVTDSRMNRSLWKPYIKGEINKFEFDYISYMSNNLKNDSSNHQD